MYGYNEAIAYCIYLHNYCNCAGCFYSSFVSSVSFFFLFTSKLSVQTVIGLKKLNQKRQKKISSDHIIPSQFLPLNQSPQSHLYCSGLFVLLKHFLPFKHGLPVSQTVTGLKKLNQKRQKKISSDHIIPSQFLPLNQSPQSHLYCSGLFVLLKHFLPFKHGLPVSQMV